MASYTDRLKSYQKKTGLKDAVITGLGAVMPIGNDFPTYWSNLVAGVTGTRTVRRFDPEAFEVLCRVPVTFQLFSETEDTLATSPLVQVDPEGKAVGVPGAHIEKNPPGGGGASAASPAAACRWHRTR